MRTMNPRRHLVTSAILSFLLLGASAYAQGRPTTTHGGTARGSAVPSRSGGSRVVPNPEPFFLALLGLGGAGLAYSVKRRRRQEKKA